MRAMGRRAVALLMCVFVLTAGTPFFVFAEPGLQEIPACTEPGGHVFDVYKPAQGGTHYAVCSLCGGEFQLDCEIAPDAVYTYDSENCHTAVCALCGGTVAMNCVYADPPVWTDQGDGTHGTACTLCGGLKTEQCTYTDEVTLPTQTEPGYTTHTCEICLATYTDAETPPECERQESTLTGDTDGDGRVTSADARTLLRVSVSLETLPDEKMPYGDMNADGAVTSADARLALRVSVSLEPLPERHDYTVEVTKEATCKEPGALTFICAYCGAQGTLEIPAAGHRFEVTKRTEPTCTDPGQLTEVCVRCGDQQTVTLAAKGHDFHQTGLKEPTCTQKGEEAVKCSVCGTTETHVLPALGHDWIEATPAMAKHCDRCGKMVTGWTEIGGDSYYFKDDGTPMKGKNFIDGLLYTFSSAGVSRTGRTGKKPKVAVIGDSIVASIANYNVATDFDMYGKVSLHVNTIDSKKISGSSRTVLREVEGRGYDVVILMLGVNDLTYVTSVWGEMYRGVLRDLKEIAPEALIYANAILPINDQKTSDDEKMWRVVEKNKEIKKAAKAEGVRFLDIPPKLLDANGQLPYDAASDGIHFGPTYCRLWYDWTRDNL